MLWLIRLLAAASTTAGEASHDELRAELRFKNIRGPHRSLGGPLTDDLAAPPLHMQRLYATHGELFQGKEVPPAPNETSGQGARFHSFRSQFSSDGVYHATKFDGNRPIWNAKVWRELEKLAASGETLSPGGYPSASEDLVRAIDVFLPRGSVGADGGAEGGAGSRGGANAPPLRIAVFSAISPWVEATLMHAKRSDGTPLFGARPWTLTTVDYNEPFLLQDGKSVSARGSVVSAPLWHSTLHQGSLAQHYAKGHRFDCIIAFSGIEHDGLGRYGDPPNPDGDMAAMGEMRLLLARHGHLLLAVPTGTPDDIQFPMHRVYGPRRLPALTQGYELLGRVWQSKDVKQPFTSVAVGGVASAAEKPALFPSKEDGGGWQHQPVLVLRKVQDE